jgi:hypothetical protein
VVTIQNFGYDRFPPATNDWGTIHPISDKAPPLQTEVEGPPTWKELIPGVICIINFTLPR